MGLQAIARFPVVISLDSAPAADNELAVWRAPSRCKPVLKDAYAISADDVAASTANYFSLSLINKGTAGAGTTVIGSVIGGTAGWSALVPKSFAPGGVELAEGDVIALRFDKEGTGTFAQLTVQLDVVY